jgi:uncharacterized membrane protein
MEKRVIGVILTLLGVIALIVGAYNFMNHTGNMYNIKLITTCCILGLIFFFAGIGLIRGTKDTLKNDEHVSS